MPEQHLGIYELYAPIPKENTLNDFPTLTSFRADPEFYLYKLKPVETFEEACMVLRYANSLKQRSSRKLHKHAQTFFDLLKCFTDHPDDVIRPSLQFMLHIWPIMFVHFQKSVDNLKYIAALHDNHPEYDLYERLKRGQDYKEQIRLLTVAITVQKAELDQIKKKAIAALKAFNDTIAEISIEADLPIENMEQLIDSYNHNVALYNEVDLNPKKTTFGHDSDAGRSVANLKNILYNFSNSFSEVKSLGINTKKILRGVKPIKYVKKSYRL